MDHNNANTDIRNMEQVLVEQCSPTLAGIKCAGLFNYIHSDKILIQKEINEINSQLNGKGVYIDVLAWRKRSALVLAYRPAMLQEALQQPGVDKLLYKFGYNSSEMTQCIEKLKQRVAESTCFPHEIGIFLGYPLEDVSGFIQNGGENCESCGEWKVYCNKEDKDILFQKFQKCREVYMRVFCEGRTISKMTVCI